jgi:hypothetical protein
MRHNPLKSFGAEDNYLVSLDSRITSVAESILTIKPFQINMVEIPDETLKPEANYYGSGTKKLILFHDILYDSYPFSFSRYQVLH